MPPVSTARLRLLEAMIDLLWERPYSATSVDHICERADVRKGSFYHFFPSKASLAVAALDHLWETESRPTFDAIFAPDCPPLVRFQRMIAHWYERTVETKREKGRVLGCPFFNIGTEAAAVEPELLEKAREILTHLQGYLEATLREAVARGDVSIADPVETAGFLFSLIEGCATQARIHDDPERVRDFSGVIGRMLGTDLAAVTSA